MQNGKHKTGRTLDLEAPLEKQVEGWMISEAPIVDILTKTSQLFGCHMDF